MTYVFHKPHLLRILLVKCVLIFSLQVIPIEKAHAVDPRVKMMAKVAAYGTVGGALLGAASLAFGAKSKAIFQGASIGLYAGLIFGIYILYTHEAGQAAVRGGYDDAGYENPYSNGGGYDSPYGGGDEFDRGQRWDAYHAFDDLELNQLGSVHYNGKLDIEDIPISINFFTIDF